MKIHNPTEVDSEIVHYGQMHILKAGETSDKTPELCRHWQSVHEFLEITEEQEKETKETVKKIVKEETVEKEKEVLKKTKK